MEKNEFEESVKSLANKFYTAVSKIEPCKVSFGFDKDNRCKNLGHINIATQRGVSKRYEVWQAHSGEVCWDVKDIGFSGVFA